MGYLIANLIVLGLSLGVLALNVKLYTEILKDKSQDNRSQRAQAQQKGPA